VRRICRAFDGPLRDYHEQRDALVMEYGEGGSIGPDSEQWAAFAAEYHDLLAVEVPVECERIDIADLHCGGIPIDIEPEAIDLLETMGVLAVEPRA
jgi:hypothetical protein